MASIRQIYRRWRFGAPIVVVSGLPRSGTSMAMKMLEAGGVQPIQDGIRTADEDNPKGYYEHERVKDLHKEEDPSWLQASRGKAIKIISFLLAHMPETNNYKVIFMRRDIKEVLASQAKMLTHRDESNDTDDKAMTTAYKDHLWKVNRLLKRRKDFETLDLEYRGVLDDPQSAAERISQFLGTTPDGKAMDIEKMVGVVDKNLYRNRAANL